MTIRVTIKNEDPRETARIEVQVRGRAEGADTLALTGTNHVLPGGSGVTEYVHSHQELHIREISQ